MFPSPQQIVDSNAWQEMAENLTNSLLDQFLLAPASDPQSLQLIRLRYDALRSVLAEMAILARGNDDDFGPT